jgi:uncharacterized membrane protein YiaA
MDTVGHQQSDSSKGNSGQMIVDPLKITARDLLRPASFAALGGIGLIGFYLGVITLAQDWFHAWQQLGEDGWFIGVIAIGFGIQIGLFTYLRQLHARMAASGVVASTGTSTAAMLACCAHHLAEILPIIGLSGAAMFLEGYKSELLWLAIVMNLFGVLYLLRKVRGHRRMSCHMSAASTDLQHSSGAAG